MKYCPNCGNEVPEGAQFCNKCGASISVQQEAQQQAQQPVQAAPVYSQQNPGMPSGVSERNIVLAIVLSIITCGIYGIYWFIVMTDDVNRANQDPNATSGGMAFLFTIITCGIYGLYWYYKMGKSLYEAGQKTGRPISDNSILYLILGLFGFGIISYALIQSDLNKFANN